MIIAGADPGADGAVALRVPDWAAWATYQWGRGVFQSKIADEIDVSAGAVSQAIADFLSAAYLELVKRWGTTGRPMLCVWDEDRRNLARKYFEHRSAPPKPPSASRRLSPALIRARQEGPRAPEYIRLPPSRGSHRGRIFDPDEQFRATRDIWRNVWLTYTLRPDGFASMEVEQ